MLKFRFSGIKNICQEIDKQRFINCLIFITLERRLVINQVKPVYRKHYQKRNQQEMSTILRGCCYKTLNNSANGKLNCSLVNCMEY